MFHVRKRFLPLILVTLSGILASINTSRVWAYDQPTSTQIVNVVYETYNSTHVLLHINSSLLSSFASGDATPWGLVHQTAVQAVLEGTDPMQYFYYPIINQSSDVNYTVGENTPDLWVHMDDMDTWLLANTSYLIFITHQATLYDLTDPENPVDTGTLSGAYVQCIYTSLFLTTHLVNETYYYNDTVIVDNTDPLTLLWNAFVTWMDENPTVAASIFGTVIVAFFTYVSKKLSGRTKTAPAVLASPEVQDEINKLGQQLIRKAKGR